MLEEVQEGVSLGVLVVCPSVSPAVGHRCWIFSSGL